MKKKLKARAAKKRTPAKRLAARRKPQPKADRDTKHKKKSNQVTIHPSGKDVSVSRETATAYRLAKRTT